MAKNYSYKEQKTIIKKLAGLYNAGNNIVEVDGIDKNILDELKDFDGSFVEVVIKEKDETDLSNEE